MKNIAMIVLRASLSALLMLVTLQSLHAAEFFCPSGNVTWLIAAIHEANLGAAIRNDGRAVLVDTELYSNFGEFHEAAGGGAIGNRGELIITRGVIRGNNGFSQGGIASFGHLTMADSVVVENEGGFFSGGLFLSGTATIMNTTIARNSGRFAGSTFGGGITVFRGF